MIGAAAREAVAAVLRRAGRELNRQPAALLASPERRLTLDLEHLIALRLLEGTDLFFVQIGAFDGRTGDQLHDWVVRYGWRGILVEPQPRYFAALQRTYADQPQLDLRRVAVSDAPGTRTLYSVRPDARGLPAWAPQVASFDRDHVAGHGLAGEVIDSIEVECVPFREILAGVERVDLLQVDVEGYDAEIIRMFDFDTYRPSIVRFENKHLSRADHDAAIGRLLSYGYSVAVVDDDTVAAHGASRRG